MSIITLLLMAVGLSMDAFAVSISRSDVYIQIYSTSIQLLFCSFQDRFRISFHKCFVYCRSCGGKSLTNCYKFCHSVCLL